MKVNFFQALGWKSLFLLLPLGLGGFCRAEDSPVPPSVNQSQDIPHYVYWQGAASEARKPYEAELITLLMKVSEEKYGAATLEVSQRLMSTPRAIKILREGKDMQVMTAPFMFSFIEDEALIVLPHMILNNLLGYRQLIVRKQDLSAFSAIDDVKEFWKRAAGQGSGWGDVTVYNFNDIRVVEAPTFEGLFPMLQYKRFDYLPLGISEARQTYEVENLKASGFSLVENLIIFYPWPVQIMVSRSHSTLAERLDYGMQVAKKSGEYEALFNKHFHQVITEFNRAEVKIIKLKTPRIDASMALPPILFDKSQILN